MKCIICNEDCTLNNRKRYFSHLDNYHCISCDTYFYSPDIKLERELDDYYSGRYWSVDRGSKRPTIISMFNRLLNSSEKSRFNYLKNYLKENKNFLDIGSGRGEFINYLNDRVKTKISIVEPDANNCNKIRSRMPDVKIYNSKFELANIPDKFDFIYMSHVLEHMINIDEILRKIKSIMKEKALLYIEVPNNKNKSMFIESSVNNPHTIEFSEKSLRLLLTKYGFRIEKFSIHGNLLYKKAGFFAVLRNIMSNGFDPYPISDNGMNIRMLVRLN